MVFVMALLPGESRLVILVMSRRRAFDYTLTSQYEPTRKITRYDTKIMDASYYDGHVNFLYFVFILSLFHLFRICAKLELVFFFFANNRI